MQKDKKVLSLAKAPVSKIRQNVSVSERESELLYLLLLRAKCWTLDNVSKYILTSSLRGRSYSRRPLR